jgi:hypothetical protein
MPSSTPTRESETKNFFIIYSFIQPGAQEKRGEARRDYRKEVTIMEPERKMRTRIVSREMKFRILPLV